MRRRDRDDERGLRTCEAARMLNPKESHERSIDPITRLNRKGVENLGSWNDFVGRNAQRKAGDVDQELVLHRLRREIQITRPRAVHQQNAE